MKYNYIDLFSGAGGMSLGFDLEGFKNVFSVEYDLQTAQTYRYNFPNHVLINKDIQEISTNEIKKIINNNTVDVIIGGPPCQGFSLAGKFGRTFIDDPRNQLFKEYLRFVSILKPKIFIIENVARLVSHNKGKTIREIQESIEKLGYKVKYEILQTSDYNIPQKRQRVFIVGYKNIEFNYPEKLKRKVTIKEAISDLPPLKKWGKI
ncbi:DNA cytosine methyltransferase [Staphylococcus epidermidis]